MGNGGYPGTDLKLGQNSKFRIFKFCFLEFFVLGLNLSLVVPFPTTRFDMLNVLQNLKLGFSLSLASM